MKNRIFIPNDFTQEEIDNVLQRIWELEHTGKMEEEDYVLVDDLDGYINISVYVGVEIDKLAKEIKTTPEKIMMVFMRDQNRDKRIYKYLRGEELKDNKAKP